MAKLTALAVSKLVAPGRYGDGGGLYLLIGPAGTKSWVFRYKVAGRERAMGLGAYPATTLAEARAKAAACQRTRLDGRDPLGDRKLEREQQAEALKQQTTFQQCAEEYVCSYEASWKNSKHKAQWKSTLRSYAFPVIGNVAVAEIDVPAVLAVLEPIWQRCPETASRLRGRIEAILDWAKVKGMRLGENPARWKGNLDFVLPRKSKLRKTIHHPALPYNELQRFMARLRDSEGCVSNLALQFLVLTAARTSEVRLATWDEIDLTDKVWCIPAERMKAGRPHKVPLSNEAISALFQVKSLAGDTGLIFKSYKPWQPISDMAILSFLRRLNANVTAHGFRSTFRDWASETTNYPSEAIEMALAHSISNKVEAAYRRGDLLEKRKQLMSDWGTFATKAPGQVLPFNGSR